MIPEYIAAFLFIAFCASLGPLLDWEHERWLKTLESKRARQRRKAPTREGWGL